MSQTTASTGSTGSTRAARPGMGPVLAGLAAGLVVGVLATLGVLTVSGGTEDVLEGRIDSTRYQAVILSNDKVYFGRLQEAGPEFFELRDAYFVRETVATEEAEGRRQVLPISREIHTPENRMLVRKAEVVIVEDLSPQSEILQEIRRQAGG